MSNSTNFQNQHIRTDPYLQAGYIDERRNSGTPVLFIRSGAYKVEIPEEAWDELEQKYPKWRVLLNDDVEFVLNSDGGRPFASSVRPVLSHQETGICTYWNSNKNFGFLMRETNGETDSDSDDDGIPHIPELDASYSTQPEENDSDSELSSAAVGLSLDGFLAFEQEQEDAFEDAYEEIFIHISDLWDCDYYDRGQLHLRPGDEVMFTPFKDHKTGKKKAVNARYVQENPGFRAPPKRVRKTPSNSAGSSRRDSIVSDMTSSGSIISFASTTSNAWSEGTGVSFEADPNAITNTSNFTYTKNVRGRCTRFDRKNGVMFGYLRTVGHPQVEFDAVYPNIHKNTHVRFTLQTCTDSFGVAEVRAINVRRDLTRDIAWFKKEIRKCEQKIENLRAQREQGRRIGKIEKEIRKIGDSRAQWEMWLQEAREQREQRKEEKDREKETG